MNAEIIALYRDWVLTITDNSAIGIKFDSDERFECYRQPDIEGALRMARDKVNWNEGPEAWIEGYTDEELR